MSIRVRPQRRQRAKRQFLEVPFKQMLLLSALLLWIAACAQPAPETVVERYFASRGGRATLENLHAIVRSGSITFYWPEKTFSGLYRTCLHYPHTLAIELNAPPVQVNELLIDGRAYRCEAGFKNCLLATPDKAQELRDTALEANRELLYDFTGDWQSRASLQDHGSNWEITLTDPQGATRFHFHKQSGLLSGKRRAQQERRYHDWRPIGIALPFIIEDYHDNQLSIRVELHEAALKSDLSDSWCAAFLDVPPSVAAPSSDTPRVAQ